MKEKSKKKTVVATKTTDKKKEKRNLIIGIAMMVFAVAISVGTYAYYQTTITGTVSGTILAWDCKDGNVSVSSIDLSGLKPGSNGEFTFTITSANFKTDKMVKLWYTNSGNVPANFKLYKTKSGTNYSTEITMTSSKPGTAQFSTSGVTKNTATSYTVYYNWPYGTTVDTPISTTSNVQFTLNWEVTCTQSATQ